MRRLGADMAHAEPPRRATESPVGDQRHLLAHALAGQRGRRRQHLAHARPAGGAFVADDDHLALLVRARLDGGEGVFFAFKHAGGAAEHLFLGRHARHLHDGPVGADVAAQAHHAAGLGQRSADGIDHPPIRLSLDLVQFRPQRAARCGHAIAVHIPRPQQFLHHHRHAADLVQVLGHIFPARPKIDEIGRVAHDVGHVEQVEIDPRFMRYGGQVQRRIGGPASAGHHTGGVLQRLQRHHIAGADVPLDQVHHGNAAGLAVLVAAFIGGRRTAGIQQRQTDSLGHAGHRVCGVLRATGSAGRAGDPLHDVQFRLGHRAGLHLAHGLEHVLDGDVLTLIAARQD